MTTPRSRSVTYVTCVTRRHSHPPRKKIIVNMRGPIWDPPDTYYVLGRCRLRDPDCQRCDHGFWDRRTSPAWLTLLLARCTSYKEARAFCDNLIAGNFIKDRDLSVWANGGRWSY